MPIEQSIAVREINRLSSLPFFSAMADAGKIELVNAMAREARSVEEAQSAISALLSDTGRAGNIETNRVPSPGEIRVWLQAQRSDKYDSPAEFRAEFCGRAVAGKTYLSHNWKSEPTPEEVRLEVSPPQYLVPSRCVRGWVHWTIWVPVKPERIHEDGSPVCRPYEFSGRCKCQPGGAI